MSRAQVTHDLQRANRAKGIDRLWYGDAIRRPLGHGPFSLPIGVGLAINGARMAASIVAVKQRRGILVPEGD
jgi:hypothetical protein